MSHFLKQNMIEVYKNIWLIHQNRIYTNPSSAIISRYCTCFKSLLFSMVSLFVLFVWSIPVCGVGKKKVSILYNLFTHHYIVAKL